MTKKQYYRLKLHKDDAFSKPPYLHDDNNKEIMPEDYEKVLWYKDHDSKLRWFPEKPLYFNCKSFLFHPKTTFTPINND